MIHDPPREHARPVEELARAMQESKAWASVFGAGHAEELARVVLRVMRSRGWISDLGHAAIKAEAAQALREAKIEQRTDQ